MTNCPEPPIRPGVISGRKAVLTMFAFGILATALLFLYWKLHLMPFMPLQEAIVREFPGSAPRVDGGQRKMSRNTPVVMRIVMKTELNPATTNAAERATIRQLLTRVAELTMQHSAMPGMQYLELHLYQLNPEREIIERSFRFEPATGAWENIDTRGRVLDTGEDSSAPGATAALSADPQGGTPDTGDARP